MELDSYFETVHQAPFILTARHEEPPIDIFAQLDFQIFSLQKHTVTFSRMGQLRIES